MKNIMVYIEIANDSPINVSLESLTLANRIASSNNAHVTAVLIGENLEKAIKTCTDFGVDQIICIEEKVREVEKIGKYLIQLNKKYFPEVIIFGSTQIGKDLAAMLASNLDVPAFTDIVSLKQTEQKNLELTLAMYGGNVLREVVLPENKTAILLIRSGVSKKEKKINKNVVIFKEVLEKEEIKTMVLEEVKEVNENINLEEAEIIVTAGRGIGNKENIELVKRMAELLGGVVGGTRPVTEEEWLPRVHQIGQSGKIVSPKLYIACGVSGATQHVSGMISSDYIVAINKDEDASIFDIADIGIVGNVLEVLPLMIEEIKNIKSK